jgi:hypothetical protein
MSRRNTPSYLSLYKDSKGNSTLKPFDTKFSIQEGAVHAEKVDNELVAKDIIPANRKAKRMQKRRTFNFSVRKPRNKTRTKLQKASRRANRA